MADSRSGPPASDLFAHRAASEIASGAPLADRMRPRTLEEFVGQPHILGPGRLLTRAIEADRLASIILHGPPGTGKTTLARVIANTTSGHFTTLNAVLSGVKDIRGAIEEARDKRGLHGQRTILFVDEVHRFNKAQQDALLPWVENGTVILVGATTENPFFEVNKALVSRSRVFQLVALGSADLRAVALHALADGERGYGGRVVEVADEALDHLVNIADGDARALLNALELAVETTPGDADGIVRVDLSVAEESIQRRAVLYDKEGDAHYDAASAFIKSLRGSDPDAALYWLARMVYAGEDPRFLFRRMLILASEDVGMADPQAVVVTQACAAAFEYVGLPEGQFHLTQAAIYLALAPKSNSSLGYFDALDAVQRERSGDVPAHMKDANRDKEGFGHGEGYRYPHAYRDHWVAQTYLPATLVGRVFYRPSREGFEGVLAGTTAARREAQLAAALETDSAVEVLSFTGATTKRRAAWLDRVTTARAAHLAAIRDAVLDRASVSRHAVVLDLGGSAGLLTWDALRRAPEGGVYVLAGSADEAAALEVQAANLDAMDRPVIAIGSAADIQGALESAGAIAVRFDAIVARGQWLESTVPASVTDQAAGLLAEGGRLSLALPVPSGGPGPSNLLTDTDLDAGALADLRRAEVEALRVLDAHKPTPEQWMIAARAAGLTNPTVEVVSYPGSLEITAGLVARWFGQDGTYRSAIAPHVDEDSIAAAATALNRLVGTSRPWHATVALFTASSPNHPGGQP